MDKRELQPEMYKFMFFRVLLPMIGGGIIGWNWRHIEAWFQ